MEEDIEDLEKYISFSKKSYNFSHDTDWKWNKEIGEKIEHLLKVYKELEEELNSVKEIYYTQKEIEENYIEKSLVEEKIEELKEKRDDYLYKLQVYGDFRINEPNYSDLILQMNFKIQVLQELLEKRK